MSQKCLVAVAAIVLNWSKIAIAESAASAPVMATEPTATSMPTTGMTVAEGGGSGPTMSKGPLGDFHIGPVILSVLPVPAGNDHFSFLSLLSCNLRNKR